MNEPFSEPLSEEDVEAIVAEVKARKEADPLYAAFASYMENIIRGAIEAGIPRSPHDIN